MTKTQIKALEKTFNDEGVVVDGSLIKGNTVYTVVQKSPKGGPDVYRIHLESEKERVPGNGNSKVFAVVDSTLDTGFHPSSDVFSRMRITDFSERSKKSEEFKAIFLEGLRAVVSPEVFVKLAEPRAFEVFENSVMYSDLFMCELYEGRQFNTSNPRDRFQLYLAVISGGLIEKGTRTAQEKRQGRISEKDSSTAQYCFESKEVVRSSKEKAQLDKFKAIGEFGVMLMTERNILIDILNYNFPLLVTKKDDDDTLNIVFNNSIVSHKDESKSRTRKFLEAIERYKEDKQSVEREMEIYGLLLNNKEKFYNEKRKIVVGDHVFANAKIAVPSISKSEELFSEFYDKINN